MNKHFTLFILAAMVLGIAVGAAIFQFVPKEGQEVWAGNFKIVTDVFLRLIKMIIAPLVFATLVAGIAHIGDTTTLGRVGIKTMAWFLAASLVSLTLGAVIASLLHPGVGLNLPIPPVDAVSDIKPTALTLKDFIIHLVPKSIVEAMANNEILQIVVFSIFFGVAVTAMGEEGKPLADLADKVSHAMLKLTGYVMSLAPLAVFAAVAAVIATKGLAVLGTYASFIGGFYLALMILWGLLLLAGFVVIGPAIGNLIARIREPTLLAFSTASSEAAYPKTMEQLEKFGVSRRIASFVLPLGYSFNLDGSMMYCTFATLFIAQAYGIHLTVPQIATMLLLLMVTSKGMAGVPRASLVVIAATLSFFKIPEAGILLILAVDHFLDMGRSATNVIGNSIATAVVAKWEGDLTDDELVADQKAGIKNQS
ncbi:dicarboxylate/amino acid:cation symporter [Aquidulcibacter sp.]|uniref:dicarboxylate/amino acid:cation symporter n=1 Tax=Aquidulcibacter sp. TaxID=2052990 RepID=UPI0025B849F2|nr:dicarboxylate/amino acid:cation symporter [Aquidulcibacter sp.]MCA3693413.1 dicarboxylate/amino acid:cation symporter [Aquidulcibacter sp.]